MVTNNKEYRIDEKLNSLPKPTMTSESKHTIHSILLEELHNQSSIKRSRDSYKHYFINLAGIAVLAFLAFFIFNSIQGNNLFSPAEPSVNASISFQGITYNLEDHAQFKGSYTGDNSTVGAILEGLPGAQSRKTFELQTKKPPYVLTINYGWQGQENLTSSKYQEYWADKKRMLLYNVTVLFMVIDNLDSIDVNLEPTADQMNQFQFTRAEIEALYGRNMNDYINDSESWEHEVLPVIKSDSAIDEFYSTQ
jgi:hypothetical protein